MTIFIRLLVVFLLASTIAGARVVEPAPRPARFNPGGLMRTLTDWNPTVVGVYTWVNDNIVATLNKLTAKGDFYIYDGAMLQKLPVGADGEVLRCDESEPFGVKWEAFTGEDPRATKGDIIYRDALGNILALPVGADGQVLTLVDGLPSWSDALTNPLPAGAIAAWSPAAAGTSTIPTGWTLCDGTADSPNLIGLFVIGTKPTGSSSSPSPGGFGAYTADTQHGGATHTHSKGSQVVTITGDGSTSTYVCQGGTTFTASKSAHTHTANNFVRPISAGSCEPADYALVYIMKL